MYHFILNVLLMTNTGILYITEQINQEWKVLVGFIRSTISLCITIAEQKLETHLFVPLSVQTRWYQKRSGSKSAHWGEGVNEEGTESSKITIWMAIYSLKGCFTWGGKSWLFVDFILRFPSLGFDLWQNWISWPMYQIHLV